MGKTKLTSTVGETTTDLVELSQKYYNSDDTSGVNTSDELDEVLDKLIAEDGTYDLAIQTVLQYTDEDGTPKGSGHQCVVENGDYLFGKCICVHRTGIHILLF